MLSIQGEKKKIVAVLPHAGEYAKNPRYLNCVENGLGLRDWLTKLGHEYITTADKDGPTSGVSSEKFRLDVIIVLDLEQCRR